MYYGLMWLQMLCSARSLGLGLNGYINTFNVRLDLVQYNKQLRHWPGADSQEGDVGDASPTSHFQHCF